MNSSAQRPAIPRLGVNIDHIATLRQLRGTPYPNVVEAGLVCERAGAQQITVHLREDRRHIQDADVKNLLAALSVPLNLEMAVAPEIVKIALKLKPARSCLVPEKRHEVTTEGGLDVKRQFKKIAPVVQKLQKNGTSVSLFIEPSVEAVRLSHKMGAHAVEFHTGRYCMGTQSLLGKRSADIARRELERLQNAAEEALSLGIEPHAGHGLDYGNVRPVVDLRAKDGKFLIFEYNIGHSIVCRAAMVGLERAVREMASAVVAP